MMNYLSSIMTLVMVLVLIILYRWHDKKQQERHDEAIKSNDLRTKASNNLSKSFNNMKVDVPQYESMKRWTKANIEAMQVLNDKLDRDYRKTPIDFSPSVYHVKHPFDLEAAVDSLKDLQALPVGESNVGFTFDREQLISTMRYLKSVHGQPDGYKQNGYKLGMCNGMELMLAVVEERDPVFKSPESK